LVGKKRRRNKNINKEKGDFNARMQEKGGWIEEEQEKEGKGRRLKDKWINRERKKIESRDG